jgi:aminopeptidase-like protein
VIATERATNDQEALLGIDPPAAGRRMHDFMTELFPICRSISGEGVRTTHDLIRRRIPIQTQEVPSGARAFDWVVPREWNVREAYLVDPRGERIADVRENTLHLLGYSVPFRGRMSLVDLRPHLHSLPKQPDAIPYRTSYYEENWGFCLTHRQLESLVDGMYEVVVDTELTDGGLTYSELVLPGELEDEVLFSTYTCHPSMCNDNLSGVVLTTLLAERLARLKRRYTYRFLFLPETIGAIVWLSLHEAEVSRIRHGLVVTCVGDPGPLTYKKSRRGNADVDRVVAIVLRDARREHSVVDFFPSGSDERQYCSPGFDLPVGSLMRTPYRRFPEYHTSLDDLSFVRPEHLGDTFAAYAALVHVFETDRTYVNLYPKAEPQLGRRRLYRAIGTPDRDEHEAAILWVLNLSDGRHSLIDIADRSGLSFRAVKSAADVLLRNELLAEAGP